MTKGTLFTGAKPDDASVDGKMSDRAFRDDNCGILPHAASSSHEPNWCEAWQEPQNWTDEGWTESHEWAESEWQDSPDWHGYDSSYDTHVDTSWQDSDWTQLD